MDLMRWTRRYLAAFMIPGLLVSGLWAAEAPRPAPAGSGSAKVSHPVLLGSYSQGKVYRVSADGKVEWDYPARNVQDVWALGRDLVLFSHRGGATIVNRAKKVVWDFKAAPEVHSVQPLPGRRVLISLSGQSKIIEVDRTGQVVKTVTVQSKDTNRHMQLRHSRLTRDGTYLVVLSKEQLVDEYDAAGKRLRRIKAPEGFSFDHVSSAVRLANGNTLIGTGYGKSALEIDKAGKVVWSCADGDIPGVQLTYVAAAARLANGNTVLTCYKGTYQLVEVRPDRKVVWSLNVEGLAGIAASDLLDQKVPACK